MARCRAKNLAVQEPLAAGSIARIPHFFLTWKAFRQQSLKFCTHRNTCRRFHPYYRLRAGQGTATMTTLMKVDCSQCWALHHITVPVPKPSSVMQRWARVSATSQFRYHAVSGVQRNQLYPIDTRIIEAISRLYKMLQLKMNLYNSWLTCTHTLLPSTSCQTK
jgi:hypothetical protein